MPVSGGRSPVSAPSRVDLPAPDGPIMQSRQLSGTGKLTWSSSTLPPLTFTTKSCTAERGAADPDDVLLSDRGPGYSPAVDEGAILAAKVGDLIASRGQPAQLGVMGGGVEVIG